MDIRKVKKLIEMLEESRIDEIEIHEGEESVRISRNSASITQTPAVIQAPETQSVKGYGEAGAGMEATPAAEAMETAEPEENIVRAPMVGIFYEAQAPGKPSFVELGQVVKEGDALCIIEAMKIMNQVEAERGGVISKIMVETGEPVEYGQPLFVIREA